ncbi:MAG: hypothetical protein LC785_04765 [Acidobacteria bacterium]|nr:hypothetical protein [Acidobacteriota bacterium]MCA1641294.1 hypothetical protein [Acidobacteriota bacterium]
MALLLKRLLAPVVLLAALAAGAAPAQNTNSPTAQNDNDMARQIEKGTRQCLRDARRDYNSCRRRARGSRGRLARCRRAYDERRSGCSG